MLKPRSIQFTVVSEVGVIYCSAPLREYQCKLGTMNSPCLYTFRRCPYAIRARMTLTYSAIRVELREIKLSDMPQEFLDLSPKATVPVLRLADGTLFEESLEIMHWALSTTDPQHWLVDDSASKELIRQNDEEFKPLLDAYKYADRFTQQSQLQHRYGAEYFLCQLEARLRQHRFLVSERKTITDVAIMPFIRQFAGVDAQWFGQCEYAGVRGWLNRQIDSDLFKSAMSKLVFWQPGDDAIYTTN